MSILTDRFLTYDAYIFSKLFAQIMVVLVRKSLIFLLTKKCLASACADKCLQVISSICFNISNRYINNVTENYSENFVFTKNIGLTRTKAL